MGDHAKHEWCWCVLDHAQLQAFRLLPPRIQRNWSQSSEENYVGDQSNENKFQRQGISFRQIQLFQEDQKESLGQIRSPAGETERTREKGKSTVIRSFGLSRHAWLLQSCQDYSSPGVTASIVSNRTASSLVIWRLLASLSSSRFLNHSWWMWWFLLLGARQRPQKHVPRYRQNGQRRQPRIRNSHHN